jgi:hypothetical protein
VLVNAKLDNFGAIHSSGRNLSCAEVESCLRVFLRSSDSFSLIVRRHKDSGEGAGGDAFG